MGQITLYLDQDTEAAMKAAAQAADLSPSRWLERLIQDNVRQCWPVTVKELAGSWADLPEAEELRIQEAEDLRREPI